MKSAKFDYAKTKDLYEALTALSDEESYVKVLAGSQSLGPMMNLRLVQPDRLIDIRGLEPLRKVERREDHLFVGALVTHAEIEDGGLPDTTGGMMAHVARGIGYRAVRNRGTIGGGIVHADPAADWPVAMRVLGAMVEIEGPKSARVMAIDAFQLGAFTVALEENEIVVGVRIPFLSSTARWGYRKVSRKPGEFAESIGAFVHDPETSATRLVLGATKGAPLELSDTAVTVAASRGAGFDADAAREAIIDSGEDFEPFELRIHAIALHRAVEDAFGG